MEKRSLKEILQAGAGPVYGTCCLSTSPEFPPAVKSTGVDFVFIDTEHVAIPRDRLSWMCRTYDALGITPVVRVPEPEPYRVCEYLDGGAVGVVAPYVETVEQVVSLVGAAKFLPLKGERMQQCLNLLKQPDSAREFGDDIYSVVERVVGGETASYLREKNKRNLLFINIESLPAVERLPSLLAIPGVDGVFIGPHDLSVQLGVPCQWHHPRLHDAILDIIRTTRACGRSIGCHYSFDGAVKYQKKWIEAGADIVIHSADLKLFVNTLKRDFNEIKASHSASLEPRSKLAKANEDFTV